MANAKENARKDDSINFTLKVKASRKKNGPLEFWMDLNPDSKVIPIKDTFSTQKELSQILSFIDKVLVEINERTRLCNDVMEVNEKKKKTYFNEGYDQNFKPEFGRIDKIIHKHNSPGESAVSYARRYNGDKKPL